jgi:hypothetical protein
MTERLEFAHALSGKPESRKKTGGNYPLIGYIIRDMGILNFLYVTNTTIHINKWRVIEHESDLFWVINEKLNPLVETRYIMYKNKEIAEEHLKEIK